MTVSEQIDFIKEEVRARLTSLGYPIEERILTEALEHGFIQEEKEDKKEKTDIPSFAITSKVKNSEKLLIALARPFIEQIALGHERADAIREDYFQKLSELIKYGHEDIGFLLSDYIPLQTYNESLLVEEDPTQPTLRLINAISIPSVYRFFQRITGNYEIPWDDGRSLLYGNLLKEDHTRENLCEEILIEPADLKMIRPNSKADDPYYEEYDYMVSGPTIARVTVYSISFVAKDPKDIDLLYNKIMEALEKLGKIESSFESPGGWASFYCDPYNRPRWAKPKDKVRSEGGTFEKIERLLYDSYLVREDNKIKLSTYLDLDDTYRLYSLCQSFVKPTAQIATAMNAARYAEERGPLERLREDENGHIIYEYDFDSGGYADAIGNLKGTSKKDLLREALLHITMLYGTKQASPEEAAMLLVNIANATLNGTIIDPSGVMPVFGNLLESGSGEANSVLLYREALKQRTRQLMEAVTSQLATENGANLMSKFKSAADNLGELAKQELRIREVIRWYEFLFGLEPHLHKNTTPKADTLVTINEEEENDEHQDSKEALANRTSLRRKGKKIPFHLDRSYVGTNYTSRSQISLVPRKKMPEDLAPFINQDNEINPRQLLATLDSNSYS